MIPKKYNPCKSESEGKWWADLMHRFFELSNLYWDDELDKWAFSKCPCCTFYRGLTVGLVVGAVAIWLL